MAEFDRVRDDLALGVCIDQLEAAVGVHGWTNVESILGTKVPRASGCRFGMYEDPTTNWTQRRLIEIEGFSLSGKTHCAWNATHRIRCHT